MISGFFVLYLCIIFAYLKTINSNDD